MSFDFSKWASKSLATIEGTLDQAFGLDGADNVAAGGGCLAPEVAPISDQLSAAISPTSSADLSASRAPLLTDPSSAEPIAQDGQTPSVSIDDEAEAMVSRTPIEVPLPPNGAEKSENFVGTLPSMTILVEQREAQLAAQSLQLAASHAEKVGHHRTSRTCYFDNYS